jgi:hypothetical protein
MTSARMRALMFALLIVSVAAGLAYAFSWRPRAPLPPRAPADRPTLLLLTSLPLVFSEQFSIEAGGSPALKALETRYRVVPISVSGEAELGKGRLLLMVQPRAQPAEDLVALDQWVRGGGRVLLLADPMLEWPSDRPLGDPFRPPPMFADTGLLAHWGIRLDAPDEPGPKDGKLGGYGVLTVSPGALSGRCEISRNRLVAHCRVGRGRATIVADADFLNVDTLGKPARPNLDALLGELATLEPK